MQLQRLTSIAPEFDGFLLDAYGVFWGGNEVGLLPNAKETMRWLIEENKYVVILSNTTQLVEKERLKLERAGLFVDVHYHFLLTSGEIGRNCFIRSNFPINFKKRSYFPFCKEHPKFSSLEALFKDSNLTQADHPEDADFIYLNVPHIDGEDQIEPLVFFDDIKKLSEFNLPVICLNPDLIAFEGAVPRAVVRQGAIADLFEKLGNKVHYVGKPYPLVFQEAMTFFQNRKIPKNQILMIGDTPETDIRGANQFGLKSALVKETGIMAKRILEQGEKALRLKSLDKPNFLLKSFSNEPEHV